MHLSSFTRTAVFVALFLAGCTRFSPAVGTWTGELKPKSDNAVTQMALTMLGGLGNATLILKPDGSAFLKTSVAPERRYSWSEEDGKVYLRTPQENAGSGGNREEYIGTLSSNNEALTFDLGSVQATLTKQKQ